MRSNKKKKRIWAACLCLVFAVTTALGLLALPVKSYAEDANAEIDTLKFKQVAAGEDFAIALTYNGDLYGWSLTKAETDNNFNDSATTLGGYYPAKPHRIDVEKTYITYTSDNGEYVVEESGVSKIEAQQKVHSGGEGDEIIQIAATRTTAAFLTEQGIIYTWGKDDDVEPADTTKDGIHNELNLLCRTPDTNNPKFKPAMINYKAHADFQAISPREEIANTDKTVTSRVKSLSASEYNYVAYYYSDDNRANIKNFIWGQTVYNQIQITGTHNFAPATDMRWEPNFAGEKGKVYIGDGNA